MAAEPRHRQRSFVEIGPDQFAPVFCAEPRRKARRAGEVAEHHRDRAALGVGARSRRKGAARTGGAASAGARLEARAAIASRRSGNSSCISKRSLQHARLTDALLRLRPFGAPKNSVGPDALGVPGPCFAARETSENLQMITQRRKRLAFAPAASDVRFSDCVKRLFRSGIGAATALRPQSRWGHALWSGGVMATPTFCHALPTARRLRRLDSLALCCDDVNTFSPEHGLCQIKFIRWCQRPMRQNEARPARTARSGARSQGLGPRRCMIASRR